jgi:hypothetical protein
VQSEYTAKDVERFWGKVAKTDNPDDCWIWQATKGSQGGYGQIRWKNNKKEYAHRVAYEITFGEIPTGFYILHKCDNPPCVNPNHLFAGTHQDNMIDKVLKNRQRRGEGIPNHKLTNKQADEIRQRYSTKKESQDDLARAFGISQAQIWKIVNYKSYKTNGAASILPVGFLDRQSRPGEKNPRHKLTSVQVAEIRHLYSTGEIGYKKLSRLFGVVASVIAGIVKNELWKT